MYVLLLETKPELSKQTALELNLNSSHLLYVAKLVHILFHFIGKPLPMMATSPPLSLTFGIELEFLLGYFRDPRFEKYLRDLQTKGETYTKIGEEQREEKSRERYRILQRLQEVGISVNDTIEPAHSRVNTTRWSVTEDSTVQTTEEEETTMKPTWATGMQTNLTHEGRKALKFADVEVVSRVLPYNTDSLREIEKVVQTIVTDFFVTVNYTCGLHVHVGRESFGFPIKTLKNFATLVSCFEPQFNQLHPLNRLESPQCFLPTATFHSYDRRPWRIAEIIDNFDTTKDLLYHFSTYRNDKEIINNYWCYNFLNLLHRPDRNTIEFRQHSGTLDSATILRWTNLVCSTVAFAHNLEAEALWQLLLDWTGHEDDPEWNILKLLRDLDLKVLADAYDGHYYHHPAHLELRDPFLETYEMIDSEGSDTETVDMMI